MGCGASSMMDKAMAKSMNASELKVVESNSPQQQYTRDSTNNAFQAELKDILNEVEDEEEQENVKKEDTEILKTFRTMIPQLGNKESNSNSSYNLDSSNGSYDLRKSYSNPNLQDLEDIEEEFTSAEGIDLYDNIIHFIITSFVILFVYLFICLHRHMRYDDIY
jgi:hypothetical protein